MTRQIMTVQGAADYFGVCTDTIYNIVREKEIPYFRVREQEQQVIS
ncbi:helix-turn-helix domain-containing protein [Bacillus badius]|nr:helix-turn-helix domain-containing protein [Bacillus badius]